MSTHHERRGECNSFYSASTFNAVFKCAALHCVTIRQPYNKDRALEYNKDQISQSRPTPSAENTHACRRGRRGRAGGDAVSRRLVAVDRDALRRQAIQRFMSRGVSFQRHPQRAQLSGA